MDKPKIAILYNFNDKAYHLGGSTQGVKNTISYLEQFLISVNSIKTNWNTKTFTYEFYVIHSEPFTQIARKCIEEMGATIIYVNWNHPTYLRTFCFTEPIDCDYRLVLDNDTFALQTPKFDFTKDILGSFGGCRYNQITSDSLCDSLSLKYPNSSPLSKIDGFNWNAREYVDYYIHKNYEDIFPYFNAGALFIKNTISVEFGNLLNKSIPLAKNWANNRGLSIFLQDFYGLCVNDITSNWGAFETGFNFILNPNLDGIKKIMNTYKDDISLIHYINCDAKSSYGKIILSEKLKI